MSKRRLKTVLYGSEVRQMAIIANGIVNSTPKQVILRQLKKEIARLAAYSKLDQGEVTALWTDATRLYARISKETFRDMRISERKFGKKENYQEYLAFRKESLYSSVHKYMPELEKIKNQIADRVEYRIKGDETREILGSETIFYVCNWFSDCAKDHIPYQGKVYVNDDWEDHAAEQDVDRIRAYVRNHQIMTVREATQEAPWLTTRRNCRHKLYPISVDEVLGSSVRSILKKHNLRQEHENEYNITLTPAKVSYIGYYERLRALTYLKKMFDCPDLDKDIKETRKLVQKWRIKSSEE